MRTLVFIFLILPSILIGQDTMPLSSAERYLLKLVNQDTVSSTVAYLPYEYRFNLKQDPTRYFVLVKSGRKNFLLLDGTNQVYIPDPLAPDQRLQRIDSTVFFGDNFRFLAFYRKDSLFQYGGYGFWENRDFFTYYRPLNHDWEFYRGGDGKESLLSIHYYDPKTDMLFLLGNYEHNEHKDSQPFLTDSVYSYDFKTRHWSTLGQALKDYSNYNESFTERNFWISPFGICVLRFDHIEYFDIPGNKIYRTPDTYKAEIDKLFVKDIEVSQSNFLPIQLGDTVHFIVMNGGSVVDSKRILTPKQFAIGQGAPIYQPIQNGKGVLSILKHPWSLLVFAGVFLIAIFWWFRRHKRTNPGAAEHKNGKPNGFDTLLGFRAGSAEALAYLIETLSPVERELIKELARYSAAERFMDIATMNRILGVSQKDPESQKVRRSNAITHINTVFSQFAREHGNLIEREKDPVDKRVFQYYIPKHYLSLFNGTLS
jgi:hypothetical protein